MSTNRYKHRFTWLAGLATIVSCVIGCGVIPTVPLSAGSFLNVSTEQTGGVLREALTQSIDTLDPIHLNSAGAVEIAGALYQGLVGFDEKGRVIPAIAVNWNVDASKTVYTFQLRPGVKFTNGREVTVNDVVYSLTRLLDPKNHAPNAWMLGWAIVGADAFRKGQASSIRGLQVIDTHTLEIQLTVPEAYFLKVLAMPFCSVVPTEVVEQYGAEFGKHPVGTGPFRLITWTATEIEAERNPFYWKSDAPRLTGLHFQLATPANVAVREWKAGKIDLLTPSGVNFSEQDLTSLRSQSKWDKLLRSQVDNAVVYTGMNVQMKPFDNIKVRKALNDAIDRAKLVVAIGGRGRVATGILPPNIDGFDPSRTGQAYNPTEARALLAEAGYPNGFDTVLWTPSDAESMAVARSIQMDLANVGVRAKINPVTLHELVSATTRPANVPLFNMAWMQDYPDPDDFLNTLFHSANAGPYNETWYINHLVDQQLNEGRQMSNGKERSALYTKIESEVLADAPWIPEYWPVSYGIAHSNVHGYAIPVTGGTNYASIWLSQSAAGSAPRSQHWY